MGCYFFPSCFCFLFCYWCRQIRRSIDEGYMSSLLFWEKFRNRLRSLALCLKINKLLIYCKLKQAILKLGEHRAEGILVQVSKEKYFNKFRFLKLRIICCTICKRCLQQLYHNNKLMKLCHEIYLLFVFILIRLQEIQMIGYSQKLSSKS